MLYELILINEIEQRAKIIFLSVTKAHFKNSPMLITVVLLKLFVETMLNFFRILDDEPKAQNNSILWCPFLEE